MPQSLTHRPVRSPLARRSAASGLPHRLGEAVEGRERGLVRLHPPVEADLPGSVGTCLVDVEPDEAERVVAAGTGDELGHSVALSRLGPRRYFGQQDRHIREAVDVSDGWREQRRIGLIREVEVAVDSGDVDVALSWP